MSDRQNSRAGVMANQSRRTIRQRLIWDNFVIGLLILLAGGIALWQINRLTGEVDVLQDANEQVTVALEVRQDSTEMIALISRLLPIEDATVFESEASIALDSLRQSHAALTALLANTTPDRAEYSLMNGVSNSVESVINISETMIRQASSGQWPSVRVRLGVLLRDQQQLVNLVNQLVDLTKETEQAAAVEVAAAKQAALLFPTLVIVVTLALGVLLFWRTTQSIIRPVEQLTAGVTHLAAGSLDERVAVESVDELGQLAAAFNTMAERLQVSHGELEERIGERTRALQLTTEVSRRLSTILDQKQLVSEVVEQVQRAFNYYHVHIYLLDDAEENLIMTGGTGEAGQAMLASGHKISKGKGLVGRAAVTGDVVLASDVSQDEKWLPNPLLPDTRAEIAVPIVIGDRILGVLDVQHHEVQGLTEEDASLLQSVANQVAIALRNARLYEQAQQQAEQEALINMIGQKIQTATDVDSVLQVAARELGQALSAQQTIVQLSRSQPAIASKKAHLFREAGQDRAENEAQAHRSTQSGWENFLNAIDHSENPGYSYDDSGFTPVAEPLAAGEGDAHTLTTPIKVTGEPVGLIQLQAGSARAWSSSDANLVASVAQQVAQQIENLRLLAEADRYRMEAEEATRRLIRENWQSYQSDMVLPVAGYSYNLNEVKPIASNVKENTEPTLSQALAVRGEIIGQLEVIEPDSAEEATSELLTAVAERLSAHIENLRLSQQTEQALAEARRRSEELALINQVAQTVAQQLEPDQLLESVYAHLQRIMSVDAFIVGTYDRESNLIHFPLTYDNSRRYQESPTKVTPHGSMSQVIQTGEPILLNRTPEQIAAIIQRPQSVKLLGNTEQISASLLYVPLRIGQQVGGVLSVQSYQLNAYNEADLALLSGIANHVALALENASLFAQTQTALSETATLYQLSAEFNTAQTYDEVIAALRRHTTLGRGAQNVSLNYFDRPWTSKQTPEQIEVVAHWGELPPDAVVSRYPLAAFSSAAHLLQSDAPTLIEDLADDPRLDENTRSLYRDRFGAKSALFIPLVAGGQWIGYINAIYQQPTSFPETEIRRLMGLAGQAAVTIQTIRLLEESNRLLESEQRQRQIADTLVRSAGRMSETLSEAELRQIVVDEIIDILRPDQVNLYEWLETENAFRLELRQVADLDHAEDAYQAGQFIAFSDRPDLYQVFRENHPLLESAPGEGAYVREHYCLPWLVGAKPTGVIEVFHTARYLTIRPEDQVRCEGVVRQAAIAIQNARSFEQTRRRAEREQMVNTIMQKIQSTVTVESALQTTIRELGQALQARYTLVEVAAGKEDSSNRTPVERN